MGPRLLGTGCSDDATGRQVLEAVYSRPEVLNMLGHELNIEGYDPTVDEIKAQQATYAAMLKGEFASPEELARLAGLAPDPSTLPGGIAQVTPQGDPRNCCQGPLTAW